MQARPTATRRQRVIEREFGRPLSEVIDDLLYGKNLTVARAAQRLGVDPATLWRWRRQFDAQKDGTATAVA